MITDKSSINDEKTLGNFDLDTCRLIAVYDSEMHPIMKVNFVNDDDAVALLSGSHINGIPMRKAMSFLQYTQVIL